MGHRLVGTVSTKGSSSTAGPATSTSKSSSKSSISKSSFAPSCYQLQLFASVIQSFDSQQLRVHDTSNGRLRCQHTIKPNTSVTCLAWGQYNATRSHSSLRKRRGTKPQDVVIAYGTNDSAICIFALAEAKVVGQLVGGHERGIRDFKFSPHQRNDAWSLGGDGKLAQWNLKTGAVQRSVSLPDPAIQTLCMPFTTDDAVICASITPFAVNIQPHQEVKIESFDSMKNTITVLLRSYHKKDSADELFLSADGGRYLHVYDIEQKKLVRTLIAASEVMEADLSAGEDREDVRWDEQILSVITKAGTVELFPRPFMLPVSKNGELKTSRKNLTERATATIRLVDQDAPDTRVAIFAASLQGPELLIASIDNGAEICFQKVRWQDEGTGELLFDGIKDVLRTKLASSLNSAKVNGVKDLSRSHVDESKTVVVNGGGADLHQVDAIELNDSDDDDVIQEESINDEDAIAAIQSDSDSVDDKDNSAVDEDAIMADTDINRSTIVSRAEESVDTNKDNSEPTFGDLLSTLQPSNAQIDIASALVPASASNHEVNSGLLSLPTGISLSTVLTQALRTNDRSLLEACLHTHDQDVIRNTIQRLESSLAGILIGKIAERMASRPGRYGDLSHWVQQLCVAHGAAISRMPEVKEKLRALFKVLDQRARMLTPLLVLKGKLDMLDAQLRYRRDLAAERAERQAQGGGAIVLEGDDDQWSSDEDIDADASGKGINTTKKAKRIALEDLIDGKGSDSEDEELKPSIPNGIASDSDSGGEESDEETEIASRPNGLIDDIAEEEEDILSRSEGTESEDDEAEGLSDEESSEDGENDDEDEDDSEMDDFIDDGPIETGADDPLLDDGSDGDVSAKEEDEEEKVVKPQRKKRRH